MPEIITQRVTPRIEGDFVVFLIGMRINRLLRPGKWFPVFTAMPRMLKELSTHLDSGLLGFRFVLGGLRNFQVVQYWRSFEHLHAYARTRDGEHFPAWVDFNRRIGKSGAVGIWHETFLVRESEYEAVYHNMPAYGLGKIAPLVPASGRDHTAAGRLRRTDGDDAPVDESGEEVTGTPE